MTAPAPQTIASELDEQLNILFNQARQFDEDDPACIEFERRAKQLAKADVAHGYVLLATIAGLCGDYGSMRSRFQIAKNNGVSSINKLNYSAALAHVGFFSESADLVSSSWSTSDSLMFAFERAVTTFQFQVASEIAERAERQGLEMDETHSMLCSVICETSKVTKAVGLSDVDTAAIGDLAGEVMRDHGAYLTNRSSISTAPNDDGTSLVCSTIFLNVSYEEASDMNFELAEKVASSEKYALTNRFCIRFVGR